MLIGITCSGKTTTAKRLGELTGYNVIGTDQMYDCINNLKLVDFNSVNILEWDYLPDVTQIKKDFINKIDKEKNLILEGYTISQESERKLFLDILQPDKVTYLYINIPLSQWKANVKSKIGSGYDDYLYVLYQKLMDNLPKETYILHSYNEVLKTSSTYYQHIGYTDIKYNQLKLSNVKGKVCLDIGCSIGMIGEMLYKDGAKVVYGVDNNWAALEMAKDRNVKPFYIDLNNFDISDIVWHKHYDLVLCLATAHYIKDLNNFLMWMGVITKDTFILEMPVSQKLGIQVEHNEQRGTYIPTRGYIEGILKHYFKSFSIVGQSISPDNSYRLIFNCKK